MYLWCCGQYLWFSWFVLQPSGGHIPQHAAVNETVRHALVSVGVPVVLKPVCCDDGKRPNGMSLILNLEAGLTAALGLYLFGYPCPF